MDLTYARRFSLAYASMVNRANNTVTPSVNSIQTGTPPELQQTTHARITSAIPVRSPI
jgi:hypothetical protein